MYLLTMLPDHHMLMKMSWLFGHSEFWAYQHFPRRCHFCPSLKFNHIDMASKIY